MVLAGSVLGAVSRDTAGFPVSVDRRLRRLSGDRVVSAGSVLSAWTGRLPGISISTDQRFGGRGGVIGWFRSDRLWVLCPGKRMDFRFRLIGTCGGRGVILPVLLIRCWCRAGASPGVAAFGWWSALSGSRVAWSSWCCPSWLVVSGDLLRSCSRSGSASRGPRGDHQPVTVARSRAGVGLWSGCWLIVVGWVCGSDVPPVDRLVGMILRGVVT